MNYEKIYNQIIQRAQNRILISYKERHHIVPRCLGGSNHKTNLVYLTAREHFLCHWLLVRIYPNESRLSYAFWCMINRKGSNQERINASSRTYEEARILFSKNISKQFKNRIVSKETCDKIANALRGVKHEQTPARIKHLEKLHSNSKGKHNKSYGVPKGSQPIIECPQCKKTGGRSNMKRWHFDNCTGNRVENSDIRIL